MAIDAEGDSTMFTVCEQPNKTYHQCDVTVPQMLETYLRGKLETKVVVKNSGWGGTTVPSRLNGTKGYKQTLAQALPLMKAKFVVFNWSINDAVPGIGESIDEYKAALISVINIARADGATPIMEEPSPTSFPPAELAYVQAQREVAAQMNVPLIAQFDYLQSLPNWRSMLQPDGIHPGPQMYQIKAQREAEVLIPLIRSALAQQQRQRGS